MAIGGAYEEVIVVGGGEIGELDAYGGFEEFEVADEALKFWLRMITPILNSVEIYLPSKKISSISPRQHQPSIIDANSVNLFISLPRPEVTLRQLQVKPLFLVGLAVAAWASPHPKLVEFGLGFGFWGFGAYFFFIFLIEMRQILELDRPIVRTG